MTTVTTSDAYERGDGDLHVVAFDYGIKSTMVEPTRVALSRHRRAGGDERRRGRGRFVPTASSSRTAPATPRRSARRSTCCAELIGTTPIFGICLGHQLLAEALGGATFKLPFGHHGSNHPVQDLATGRIEITAQNHNYAVVPDSLERGVVCHVNLNDGVIEGMSLAERAVLLGAVSPRSGARTARRALPLRALRDAAAHELTGGASNAASQRSVDSIMVIGSGPIVIGQACEFDYSGTQACQVLRAEGYRVVLVNSNPATIMTDPATADATYVEPLDADVLVDIIEKERPDALLPTLGGQTALNLTMELVRRGDLERLGVEVIGARPEAIDTAEDREKFKVAMAEIGLAVPESGFAHSVDEALDDRSAHRLSDHHSSELHPRRCGHGHRAQ